VVKPASTGRKSSLPRGAIITLLSAKNPKRTNSSCWARFNHYATGMTIEEYLGKGGQLADIRWDITKGFISIDTEE